MSVPKRRPPSPHSCSRSRSPLRQRAAAKPSQLMKPKQQQEDAERNPIHVLHDISRMFEATAALWRTWARANPRSPDK